MTPDEVLDAFCRLKKGSRAGQRLPHKPLLVLLALGRWANGDHGPIPFAGVEKKLSALIQTYGPKGAGNPQEPFWRLRRDGVWELGGTEHLAAPNAVAPPGLCACFGGGACDDGREAWFHGPRAPSRAPPDVVKAPRCATARANPAASPTTSQKPQAQEHYP